jgi:hypothetical protein
MYHFSLLLFHLSDGISNHGNSSLIVATTTKSAPQTLSYMSCKSTATMVVMCHTYIIFGERRRWGGDLSSLFLPLLFLPFSLLLPPFSPLSGRSKSLPSAWSKSRHSCQDSSGFLGILVFSGGIFSQEPPFDRRQELRITPESRNTPELRFPPNKTTVIWPRDLGTYPLHVALARERHA